MGGWTIEAGALPKASGGVCGIDEFDKMSDQDRKAIHEVMEQQTTSVAKAGLIATLPAKTTIIAAANPRSGRYDEYKTPTENVDLPPAIISRFDLIFIVKDKANEERDHEIAERIFANHLGDVISDKKKPTIPHELLRKYIMYAKRECKPKMKREQARRIIDFYVRLRKEDKSFMVARNLDGIIRLCEAYAKMGLQTEVSDYDVEVILNLVQKSLFELGYDPSTGTLDMDRLFSGVNRNDRNLMNEIVTTIRSLLQEKRFASLSEISAKINCERSKLQYILRELQKQHQIVIEDNDHITMETEL